MLESNVVIFSYSNRANWKHLKQCHKNFRTERSEKKRKELEHICNFNEDRIEKDEKELALAKKTTRDAFEKYEETTRRLNAKEKVIHFSKYQIVYEINFVTFGFHLIKRTYY